MITKKCTGDCGRELEENKNNFYWLKRVQKFETMCILCKKLRCKLYRENNREKILKNQKEFRENNKEKVSAGKKVCYNKNKNAYLNNMKQYYEAHKDEIKEYKREYYKENKDEINEYLRDYKKQKSEKDPQYKMRRNISRDFNRVFKKHNLIKEQSFLKYVDWTMEEFTRYIEEQLKKPGNEWMNWNNHGTYTIGGPRVWHIDHIRPISSFDFGAPKNPNLEEIKKCWALENLRPLEALENIKKSNKITK